jgi:hypothetical protein
MKHHLYALALALGLSYAAIPAFAQDTATIVQTGTTSAADITQSFNFGTNDARITQGLGNGNNAQISQTSLGDPSGIIPTNAFAEITQTGDNNRAKIAQDHDGRVSASISQDGVVNESVVSQFNSDRSALTSLQTGSRNAAAIRQDNLVEEGGVFLEQIGNDNAADIMQRDGGFLRADVRQNGDLNNARVDQSGTRGEIDIVQAGTGNLARVSQVNGGMLTNATSITQNGTGHIADVSQMGNGFTSTISQSGSNNIASVNQIN